MQKTGVSVRRNKTNNFIDDDASKTNDSSVPFTWEQAPGQRLKDKDFSDSTTATQKVFTPCLLPPGKVFTRLESSKVDEESDDDLFSDALDTLSPNDSFSVNHSVSGVSGGYGVVETTKKKKKSLKLSDDTQSKDFMLNRFLPAAKAMTVEHPHHYASNRKPSSFMSEPTIQVRDLVPEEKRQCHNRYNESIVPPYYYQQDIDDDDEEGEEDHEDDEVSEYAYSSKRGCGMLPQLCFKDSLGMLNTVPGFKAKHNSSITFPSNDQVKSSKVAQLKSRLQAVKKVPP